MTHHTRTTVADPLTKRQWEVLSYICVYLDDHGYAPTLQEIGDGFRLTPPTVHEHVENLERKGYIRKTGWGEARNIIVLRRPDTKRVDLSDMLTLCVECGPDVAVDEDGCCRTCGGAAVGSWLWSVSGRYDYEPEEAA